MIEINTTVNNQTIKVDRVHNLASGTINHIRVIFHTSKEWEDLTKLATFKSKSGVETAPVFGSNGEYFCDVPERVLLADGKIWMSLYGEIIEDATITYRLTTGAVILAAQNKALVGCYDAHLTADAVEVILAELNRKIYDAPVDGEQYARKDGEWVVVQGGEGGGLTPEQERKLNEAYRQSHTHSNISVLEKITNSKLNFWDAKSDFSGDYNDLENKPSLDFAPVDHNHDGRYASINHGHRLVSDGDTWIGVDEAGNAYLNDDVRKKSGIIAVVDDIPTDYVKNNDPRLSDARLPKAHTHSGLRLGDNILELKDANGEHGIYYDDGDVSHWVALKDEIPSDVHINELIDAKLAEINDAEGRAF